jgi:hypothetical protein
MECQTASHDWLASSLGHKNQRFPAIASAVTCVTRDLELNAPQQKNDPTMVENKGYAIRGVA